MKKIKIKKFKSFLNEDGATLGNTNGMGNVTAATPSNTPGDVADSSIGSGDIGQTLRTYTKKTSRKEKEEKKKKKKNKLGEDYKNMYVTKYTEWQQPKNKDQ